MEKRYVCFICYKFHPEMKGVSEVEFKAGDNVCVDPKCVNNGKPLEEALRCEQCEVLYKPDTQHKHKNKKLEN